MVGERRRVGDLGLGAFGGGRAVGVDVEDADGRAHLDGVALVGHQLGHHAVHGAWQLDERLGGLDLDERLVDLDLVAHGDAPRDDVGLGETLARVGQRKVLELRHRNS